MSFAPHLSLSLFPASCFPLCSLSPTRITQSLYPWSGVHMVAKRCKTSSLHLVEFEVGEGWLDVLSGPGACQGGYGPKKHHILYWTICSLWDTKLLICSIPSWDLEQVYLQKVCLWCVYAIKSQDQVLMKTESCWTKHGWSVLSFLR